jgi:undecaprenyl diphosphate synthase
LSGTADRKGQDRTGAGLTHPLPGHIAFIMDGNGRWAAERGLPRAEGHRRGVESLRKTLRAARELGIGIITVYAFSSENWARPATEVSALMGLLRRFIRNDLAELHEAGVQIAIIGERAGLEPDICRLLDEAEKLTLHNTRQKLVIAFNYGSRHEIVGAARDLAREVKAGRLDPEAIDEALLTSRLQTASWADPDLIIRTSGEIRLSNFLLWQAAYSELVFQNIFWPDYDGKALEAAIAEYQARERRFGGVNAAAGGGHGS